MIYKNSLGTVTINNNALKDIALNIIYKKEGIIPSKKDRSCIDVETKNNEIILNVHIKVKPGIDIHKIGHGIQDDINETVNDMMSINLNRINILIDGFITK